MPGSQTTALVLPAWEGSHSKEQPVGWGPAILNVQWRSAPPTQQAAWSKVACPWGPLTLDREGLPW